MSNDNESTLKRRTNVPETKSKDDSNSHQNSTAKLPSRRPKSKSKSKGPLLNIAPMNTPMKYRLQTIGIIWHTISIPFFIILFLFTLYLGWVVWLVVILPYFIWWYGFDMHTPSNGKAQYRYREWIRNLIVWEWFVEYFPISVHKSCELEPTFQTVAVEDAAIQPDDEEDLVSENARTLIDIIFKKLGLQKRLNVIDSYSPPPTSSRKQKFKKVSVGPRYIFGYHPHGVISMGVMGTFATNAIRNEPFEPPAKFLKPFFHDPNGKPRLLPNIEKIFPLTLSTQFTLPFYRDYLLSLGLTSAAAKNIKSLINNGDNSVVIVVGGAQESLLNDVVASHSKIGNGYKKQQPESDDVYPSNSVDEKQQDKLNQDEKIESNANSKDSEKSEGVPERQIRLVLNKRKGFVKIAIELGNISLVPIFAFGEADIYNVNIPEEGSMGYTFQLWMKKVFSFTVPFFSARGVFIYDFGFLPYRNPINLCMGKPIYIPSGALAEYRAKHPESDVDLTSAAAELSRSEAVDIQKTSSRSNSFSNLFKLNQNKVPSKPTPPKQKIPAELLDHYHKLYVEELQRVYEDNKHRFGYGDVKLNIIE
ncbi:diacylglycerol O-acyltransferase 1 [[Candida] anglica]|uniref:diacylglycerol O-acyltransferase n=1 Tax=[Candida] anglica TaxID=148631 RepID=A0ABP0EJE1_9ASCO